MTPERMAELVAWWARRYTRDLPAPIARRRMDEIDADLHDHIEHERARGTSDRRITLDIASRMVRGLSADASWRNDHANPEEAMTKRTTPYPSTRAIVLATSGILLVPLLGMLLTDEVAWGPVDFALAGALLIGTGLLHQAVASRSRSTAYRAAAGVALAAALLLVVASLSVGVIGETGDRADLMYAGVLAVGIIGAILARLEPEGMARALLAMALVQALVAVIALIAGKHQAPISSVGEILGLNAMFAALFIGSALLFRHAARKQRMNLTPQA